MARRRNGMAIENEVNLADARRLALLDRIDAQQKLVDSYRKEYS